MLHPGSRATRSFEDLPKRRLGRAGLQLALIQQILSNMGWIWSSQALKSDVEKSQPSHGAAPSASSQPSTTPSIPHPSPSSPSPPTRDERAESELRSFLQELEADIDTRSSKNNRVPQPPAPHIEPSPTARRRAPSSPTSLEEELLPEEMSCRTAFDAAFYCQSLGGQFNNLYRYGGIKSCSEHWSEFWFCMKMRSTGDEQKAGMLDQLARCRHHINDIRS